jgi:probable F420-dependent oxidoreductase
MRIGIHLPQFGRAAVAGGVQRAAADAEAQGFSDVWVSDHLVIPKDQPYPAPYLCDPLQTLAFAAAATSTIGIGTSVLVGPQYTSPLALANTLATLDFLSDGRLTLGIGIGWSQKEYEALHAPFDHRGKRLDEIIDLLRTTWTEDPTTHEGTYYGFSDMRVLPKPAHPVPIWVGGSSDAALERAVTRGDGYHAIDTPDDKLGATIRRLRERRPEPEWTISMRLTWDVTKDNWSELRDRVDGLEALGVQALHLAPDRGALDVWLAGQEKVASTLGLH